jgi:flagellar basal-body rod protein FlgF
MDALIYTAMSGAERALHAQQVHANNLANMETGGFRADLELATSQAVPGYGYDASHMSELHANAVSTRAGTLRQTGRDLDVAVSGEGFLAVQAPGGGEAYTRAGAIAVDDQGALSVNGMPLLGDGGPIVLPPFTKVAVGEDGTISIQPPGQADMEPVDRLKLVKPASSDLTKNPSGLIVTRSGTPAPSDDSVVVKGGQLEGSNVSAVEEMVATMDLNRSFEMQMKLYSAADQMASAGDTLVRG